MQSDGVICGLRPFPLSFSQELLGELNLGSMRSGVPMLAVSLALEAKASHRELTSRLLSDLCGKVLSRGDVESSFDKLLRELPDLVLDTPGAPQVTTTTSTRHIYIVVLKALNGLHIGRGRTSPWGQWRCSG